MTPHHAFDLVLAWLSMGGHGVFVWGSLGMCALAFAAEVLALRAQRRALAQASDGPIPSEPLRQPVLTRQETTA